MVGKDSFVVSIGKGTVVVIIAHTYSCYCAVINMGMGPSMLNLSSYNLSFIISMMAKSMEFTPLTSDLSYSVCSFVKD